MRANFLTIKEVQNLVHESLKSYPRVFVALQMGDRPLELITNYIISGGRVLCVSHQINSRIRGDKSIHPANNLITYDDIDTNDILDLLIYPYGDSTIYQGGVLRAGDVYLEPFNQVFNGGKETEDSGVLILQPYFWDKIPEEEFFQVKGEEGLAMDFLTIKEVQNLVHESLESYPRVFMAVIVDGELERGDVRLERIASYTITDSGVICSSHQVSSVKSGDNLIYPANHLVATGLKQAIDTNQVLELLIHPYSDSVVYYGGILRGGKMRLQPYNMVFPDGGKENVGCGLLILQAGFWDRIPEEEFYQG